jgi:hypothetical protein
MQNKPEEHTQGRPWKIVKKLNTYVEATTFRDEVLAEWSTEANTLMQIKIKRMNDPATYYTVRTRQDPEKLKEAAAKKKALAGKKKKEKEGKKVSKKD